MRTEPLVGNNFRFLVNPIVFGYLITPLLALWGLEWLLEALDLPAQSHRAVIQGMLFTAGLLFSIGFVNAQPDLSQIDLYKQSILQSEQHQYLRLGHFLQEHLPQHDDITLVFGDAGAIPYSFDGRFIDFNGLTEPAIARLFQQPDGPEKTQMFVDYILGHRPDIVVLAFGEVNSEGVWQTPTNRHSPFRGPLPIEIFQAFKNYGIAYTCTIKASYDLHIGVWQSSPYAKDIVQAIRDYCAQDGYTLRGGLTIASPDNRQVVFPLAP